MSYGSNQAPTAPGLVIDANYSDQIHGNLVALLPRSASYTQLPGDNKNHYISPRPDSFRRSFSENVLAHKDAERQRSSSEKAEQDHKQPRGSPQRNSFVKCKSTKVTVPQFAIGPEEAICDTEHELRVVEEAPASQRQPDRQRIRRSISGSISRIARRSWISASRSPSPPPHQRSSRQAKGGGTDPPGGASWHLTDCELNIRNRQTSVAESQISRLNDGTRKNSLLGRKGRRPLSALLSKDLEDQAPAVPSIPKSFSIDILPSLSHEFSAIATPAVPRTPSAEKFSISGTDTPRKKDELWTAFRNLDGDFHK